MLTHATITAAGQPLDPWAKPKHKRGDPEYRLSATDLIQFGYSPLRWVRTPEPTEPPKVRNLDLLRTMLLAPGALAGLYARRPETFEALVSTCPNCKGASPAKTCRSCGLKRVQVATTRDWSASHEYCKKWLEQQAAHDIRVVTPSQWDTVAGMAKTLAEDPGFQELKDQSATLVALGGVWQDVDTGLEFPVHALVDFLPKPDENLGRSIGSLTLTGDASHGQWASAAVGQGSHVRAALKIALASLATEEPRSLHLWSICERDVPFITARRRSTPELLNAGHETLQRLMASYAGCLKTNTWPAFDPIAAGSLNAWSEVYLEPWMTQGNGTSGGYFALTVPSTTANSCPTPDPDPHSGSATSPQSNS